MSTRTPSVSATAAKDPVLLSRLLSHRLFRSHGNLRSVAASHVEEPIPAIDRYAIPAASSETCIRNTVPCVAPSPTPFRKGAAYVPQHAGSDFGSMTLPIAYRDSFSMLYNGTLERHRGSSSVSHGKGGGLHGRPPAMTAIRKSSVSGTSHADVSLCENLTSTAPTTRRSSLVDSSHSAATGAIAASRCSISHNSSVSQRSSISPTGMEQNGADKEAVSECVCVAEETAEEVKITREPRNNTGTLQSLPDLSRKAASPTSAFNHMLAGQKLAHTTPIHWDPANDAADTTVRTAAVLSKQRSRSTANFRPFVGVDGGGESVWRTVHPHIGETNHVHVHNSRPRALPKVSDDNIEHKEASPSYVTSSPTETHTPAPLRTSARAWRKVSQYFKPDKASDA